MKKKKNKGNWLKKVGYEIKYWDINTEGKTTSLLIIICCVAIIILLALLSFIW